MSEMIIPFVNILSFMLMGILKKGNLTGFHTNSFNGYGMNLDGTFNEKVIAFIEFKLTCEGLLALVNSSIIFLLGQTKNKSR